MVRPAQQVHAAQGEKDVFLFVLENRKYRIVGFKRFKQTNEQTNGLKDEVDMVPTVELNYGRGLR